MDRDRSRQRWSSRRRLTEMLSDKECCMARWHGEGVTRCPNTAWCELCVDVDDWPGAFRANSLYQLIREKLKCHHWSSTKRAETHRDFDITAVSLTSC